MKDIIASSELVLVLPIVQKLTLWDEPVCSTVFQQLCRRFPEIAGEVVTCLVPGGHERPAARIEQACLIACLIMGKVLPLLETPTPSTTNTFSAFL